MENHQESWKVIKSCGKSSRVVESYQKSLKVVENRSKSSESQKVIPSQTKSPSGSRIHMAVMNTICNSDIISVAQWLQSREHCQDKEATAFKKKHAETAAVEYLWNSRGVTFELRTEE